MSKGWTPERRAKYSEMALERRLWEQSTGPRTPEGKARAAKKATVGVTQKERAAEISLARGRIRELKQAVEKVAMLQRVLCLRGY